MIQSICAAGHTIPPFIICKGRTHISAWYEETDIPSNWKISVSENGRTNNELGLVWLKHFDAYTKTRQVTGYSLLIMDGYESHLNQHFKAYCLENKILTLCMPSHSSHILQPLNVVCFTPIKHKYSERNRGLARNRLFHISKENFLPAFKDTFFDVFTEENCRKDFEATAIVRTDARTVIDRLDIRLCTTPQQLLPEALWESRTLSNSHEFGSQSQLISSSFLGSPPEAKEGFSQLVKGADLMLHQNVLRSARITELEEQLAVLTRRRSRKSKRIQKGGGIEYGIGVMQAAADTGTSAQ